jgi:hypothetical protein
MFLASTFNFMLATIIEGTTLALVGTVIQTELVEYGDRSLEETLQLLESRLLKPTLVLEWVEFLVVRIWDRRITRADLY